MLAQILYHRDTVISSSNSDSKVDFSAGTKNVFCTLPASRAMSPSMTASTYLVNQNQLCLMIKQLISVLAGPVTITGTQTITGTGSNLMSKIEVNAIEPQCGTTLTLGASGDTITVTLASGASQSGLVEQEL